VLHRQCLAIHLVGEQRIRIERLLDGNRTLKVRHRAERHIGAIEKDLLSRILDAGCLEHVGQPNAPPARVADGAVGPLHARNGWFVEPAPISGALQHSHQLDARKLLEIIKRK
jgi:hypothetical protein